MIAEDFAPQMVSITCQFFFPIQKPLIARSADYPKGATANAVLYTLVKTAKANGQDTYEYLKYLLEEMPNNNYLQNSEILDRYLPWSPDLTDHCRFQQKHIRSFKK